VTLEDVDKSSTNNSAAAFADTVLPLPPVSSIKTWSKGFCGATAVLLGILPLLLLLPTEVEIPDAAVTAAATARLAGTGVLLLLLKVVMAMLVGTGEAEVDGAVKEVVEDATVRLTDEGEDVISLVVLILADMFVVPPGTINGAPGGGLPGPGDAAVEESTKGGCGAAVVLSDVGGCMIF